MPKARTFPELQLASAVTVTAAKEQLDSVALTGGFSLPDSYRDFAMRFGYGVLCEMFIIYIPMGDYGDSVTVRCLALKRMFAETVAEDIFEYEPDGSPELVARLVPFGISENGHTLAWDPDSKGKRESVIYAVAPKCLAVRKAAPDLYTFLEKCLDVRVKEMLGRGYEPLLPFFRPLKPVEGGKKKSRKG